MGLQVRLPTLNVICIEKSENFIFIFHRQFCKPECRFEPRVLWHRWVLQRLEDASKCNQQLAVCSISINGPTGYMYSEADNRCVLLQDTKYHHVLLHPNVKLTFRSLGHETISETHGPSVVHSL